MFQNKIKSTIGPLHRFVFKLVSLASRYEKVKKELIQREPQEKYCEKSERTQEEGQES